MGAQGNTSASTAQQHPATTLQLTADGDRVMNHGQLLFSIPAHTINAEILEGESWLDMRDRTQLTLDAAKAEAQQLAQFFAAAPALLEALKDFLEAQDALDNRELQGPNAECHFKLMARRNNAREQLDTVIAQATGAAS
jgi:hypothetical protein